MAPPPPPEQSTIGAMASGLDPREGRGVVEKVGPLLALVIYVAALFLMAFDVVPNPDVLLGLIGLLGPVVGGWAAKLGAR